MGRALGVFAIVLGTVIVGFNPNRFDWVLLDLPRGSHGIHVHDVLGAALVALGVAVLWQAGSPSRQGD